jgi:hypothetical protein
VALFALLAFASTIPLYAQKPTDSSVKNLSPTEGDREAKELVTQIFNQRPEQTFTNALLRIRAKDGAERKVPVRFQTDITSTNWSAIYEATRSQTDGEKKPEIIKAVITHTPSAPNQYLTWESGSTRAAPKNLPPEQTSVSFAGSDFSLADLGLEFLHWAKQRVNKKEMYSSRYCAVLDSINPKPAKDGYARVRAWITTEPPLAPVRAEAYDSSGKRIKVFEVKGIEKVNGRFQVEAVEMRNLQNGSRTVMEFNPD